MTQQMKKIIEGLSTRHMTWDIFSDFLEMAAISFSNSVNLNTFDEREKRYLDIVKKYNKQELHKFPELLSLLVDELETGLGDPLGTLFHELGLHNKFKGQFFTPYPLCKMMGKMTLADPTDIIKQQGFITASEPACGSGAMVIALADAMQDLEVNYQQHLHVTAGDIDLRSVHMAYIQLTLLHIPAVVIHGNSLSLEEYSHWYTPAHVLGFWNHKLKRRNEQHQENHSIKTIAKADPVPTPTSAPALITPSADIQIDLFDDFAA